MVRDRPGRGRQAPELSQTACWLGLLLIALAIHELAHAAVAALLDCDQEDVHLWPLGNLVGPPHKPRSSENFWVAAAGPLASGAIFLITAIGLNLFAGAQVVCTRSGTRARISGHPGCKAPSPGAQPVWLFGWFAI